MKIGNSELLRYSKQIILKKIGIIGQKKISSAKVLVVGVGGLGCPLVLYLANTGIGNICLVDDDVVDLSEFVDKRQRVLDVITRLKNIREYNNFPINKECLDINNHDLKLQRIVALISMAPKAKAPDNVLALRRLAYVNEQTTT